MARESRGVQVTWHAGHMGAGHVGEAGQLEAGQVTLTHGRPWLFFLRLHEAVGPAAGPLQPLSRVVRDVPTLPTPEGKERLALGRRQPRGQAPVGTLGMGGRSSLLASSRSVLRCWFIYPKVAARVLPPWNPKRP